ncbi:hypothetical protein AB4Z09_04345 [Rhodococcus sp. TAF43]|uniref:hypothetical protein n=1 Tax=Rhodococcus sp. TAF43 TaxID=3237483 RepID=UPI003F9D58BB
MVVQDLTTRQSTTNRSRVRTVLGSVVVAAGTAALIAFAPGTAGATPLLPEPTPIGSLGSAFIDLSGGMQTLLGQFVGDTGSLGSVRIGGQPTTGSLGSSTGSLGSTSTGSLGSSATGSFGSSFGSVVDSPFN